MNKYRGEITKLYIALMVAFIPLYYNDNYTDILSAKTHMIYILSFAFMIAMIPALLSCVITAAKNNELIQSIAKGINVMDVIVVLFTIIAFVSTNSSSNVSASLYGTDSWNVGSIFILICAVIYFFISRNFNTYRYDVFVYMYFGTIAIVLFSILDRLGIDTLDMFSEVVWEYDIFTSTIGNMDVYAGIFSLFLPVFMMMGMSVRNRFYKLCVYILVYLGFVNMNIVLTNTIYCGVGMAIIFVIYYSLLDYNRLKNLFAMGLMFSFAGFTVKVLDENWTIRPLDHDSFALIILNHKLYIVIGIASVLALIAMGIISRRDKETQCKVTRIVETIISKAYLVVVCLLFLAGIIYLIMNASLKMGNYRGYIWYMALNGYKEMTPFHKIVGVGPGLIDSVIQPQIRKTTLDLVRDYWYNTAHNELIEFLVTMGISGTACYLGMIVTLIVQAVRLLKKTRPTCCAAVFAGIIGYLAQGIATGPYAPNYLTFFVLLGIWEAFVRKEAA